MGSKMSSPMSTPTTETKATAPSRINTLMTRTSRCLALLALFAACGESLPNDAPDGSPIDAGTDSNADDASSNALFDLSGPCGQLDTELTETAPSTFDGAAFFHREYTEADEALLSEGGLEILRDGNAGGSSIFSELFAYEVLGWCESIELIKTENEIEYNGQSKKTDFLGAKAGVRLGVSVTRAQTFPLGSQLTVENAQTLLDDKLSDVLESSANVVSEDAWQKQILAVMVYNRQHLTSLQAALPLIDATTRADTIVWLTVTDGADEFIYE